MQNAESRMKEEGSKRRQRVVCAMSGGVDSSVAAALLVEQGYEPIGVFLRLGNRPVDSAHHHGCCSVGDALDARRVADKLGIPFYAIDAAPSFRRIIDDFADSYLAGETPNPCVRCNAWLKFGELLDVAHRLGASKVATGHYARVVHEAGRSRLFRGADPDKDQSYVLFPIGPERLRSVLFPLGAMNKEETRERARLLGLMTAEKPESQEICFVPDDYRDVVAKLRPEAARPGKVLDSEGRELGEHRGQAFYTVGQRKGLGLAAGKPIYVLSRDAASNTVVVGGAEELTRGEFLVRDPVWLGGGPPWSADGEPLRALVQIRYRHRAVPCRVQAAEGPDASRLRVQLDEPERAVAPGQAAVFYNPERGEEVLGGGWIAAPEAR